MSEHTNGRRNSLICGLLAILAFIGIGLAANAQEVSQPSEVDFAGFKQAKLYFALLW